ncbi:MAG TPA: NAD(P)-dependent oxidoreductase [Humidesulfovibrio sp.]|uniref:SDR family oxidoreductase n=1 Tax=Humidesulfovibrio sp. TaxID=2910988 RepID=UPI002CBE1383|nr:NAD(P)-dependent oxidoreductase [Humidesulfovibrio sp.]HWR03894.1 NAD(P)-dependent oxidoreductase [Humidesulfovibrio sp.]
MDAIRNGLIFGGTGKLGTALSRAFADGWNLRAVESTEADITDKAALRALLTAERPGIVFNAKVIGGVDACEQAPGLAYRVNTRFPAHLAELSLELGFTLVHFSTDAIFPDCAPGAAHTESSVPAPLNAYALSKYGADCLIPAITPRAYVLRLSVQFGERPAATQFVERMLEQALHGAPLLRVAADVVSSPSYSQDVAARVRQIVEQSAPFGLYHVANAGQASLHELVFTAVKLLGLETRVEPVPSAIFPALGRRSRVTPLASEKISALRPWQEALADFCREFKAARGGRP